MLPFEQENNKKKYTCFVCGVVHEDWDEFQKHIIDTHDEGRDYIVCPLDRCKAPIRCLRTHFKAKHPSEPLPKNMQLKAIIWRDFTASGKKKGTRKPSFREGWFESTKMHMRFYYRSGYESTVFECLDMYNEVEAFIAEPFKIPYIWKGTVHEYTPDLLVTFFDGHKELWEIKPANQTNLEQNQCKWKAAAAACEPRGWKFVVQTERGIEQLKRAVQKQLND